MNVAPVRAYRMFFALLVVAAIGRQYVESARLSSFSPVNYFSYFTNLSNLLAAMVFLVAAVAPAARTDWWRGLAVVCMTITGVVFNLLLRSEELAPLPWVNEVVHVIMPILMLVDWIVVPPTASRTPRALLGWLVPPFLWLVYTLVRGPIADWYPYPFLDVKRLGSVTVATYCSGIFVGFVVTIALVAALGNRHRVAV